MADSDISIVIRAKDEASAKLGQFKDSIDEVNSAGKRSDSVFQLLQERWYVFAGIAASAGFAARGLAGEISRDVDAANQLQGALTGLSSVARAYNVDQAKAKQAAQDLAKDGLMTVADSATGLKNLLASGFNLDQAIELMKRFKDASAFGRQSSLSFGEAVRSATEGVKNGNSILVDNSGITKNLSTMLEEAGYSAQDLMRASSDAGVRQAIYNGILKESNAQLGDAAKLSDQFAGKQARAQAQTTKLRQEIGEALQPALASLLQAVTPLIVATADWVSKHGELTAAILIGTTVLLGLVATLGVVGTAIGTVSAALPVMSAAGTLAFGTMAAGIAGVQTAFTVLAGLIATPLVMPAIAVAAAIASLVLVRQAAIDAKEAVDNAKIAEANKQLSDQMAHQRLLDLQKSGTPQQKADAARALKAGYASGGYTGRGGVNEVAGVVHKGEYVVPQKDVDQRTGKPKSLGQSISNVFNIYNQVDLDAAMREQGWRLARI